MSIAINITSSQTTKLCDGRVVMIQFFQDSWGTERSLDLIEVATGMSLASVDPFWPAGIPLDKSRRLKRIKSEAEKLITDYNTKVNSRLTS